MIKDFSDEATHDIYDGVNSKMARKIPQDVWNSARRKLDMLNAANDLKDLMAPPGNRLESLKGDLKGFFSIRINDQFRILFEFSDGHATKVKISDYH